MYKVIRTRDGECAIHPEDDFLVERLNEAEESITKLQERLVDMQAARDRAIDDSRLQAMEIERLQEAVVHLQGRLREAEEWDGIEVEKGDD